MNLEITFPVEQEFCFETFSLTHLLNCIFDILIICYPIWCYSYIDSLLNKTILQTFI